MPALDPEFDNVVSNLVPLGRLPERSQAKVLASAEVLVYKRGQTIFKEGDSDPYTFYVLAGTLVLRAAGQTEIELEGGRADSVHPIAQLQPRKMSARAKTEVTVLRADRHLIDKLIAEEQSDAYCAVEVDEIEEDNTDDWMTRMLSSKLFSNLPAANIHRIFSLFEEVDTTEGELVVKQGEPGDYYYVLVRGRAEVTRSAGARAPAYRLALIGPGDTFGEEALVGGSVRNASVTMLSDGQLVRLSQEHFNELIQQPLLSAVSMAEAEQAVADRGALWLDVRFPEEFETSSLPGAVNHPLNTLRMHTGRLDEAGEYVVFCDSGERSAVAAFLLAERGFQVHYLEGGWHKAAPVPAADVDLTLHDDELKTVSDEAATIPVPASHRLDEEPDHATSPAVRSAAIDVELEAVELERERARSAAIEAEARQRAVEQARQQAAEEAQRQAEKNLAAEREKAQSEIATARAEAKHAAAEQAREHAARETEARLAAEREKAQQELAEARAEAEREAAHKAREQAARETEEKLAAEREKAQQELAQARAEAERNASEQARLKAEQEAAERIADERRKAEQMMADARAEAERAAAEQLREEREKLARETAAAREELLAAQREKAALERAKADAEAAVQREREAQQAREQQVRAELEKRLKDEEEKIKQSYAWQAEELERLKAQKKAAEARLQEEQARVEAQSSKAREQLAKARDYQEQLKQVQQVSAEEASRREQQQLDLERRLREEMKHKVHSEREKLEQELSRNAEALERANQEREAAESARVAAAEEAQQIIREFKAAHARKRMQEEAEMQVERERLETESKRLRLALELAQREKDAALMRHTEIEQEIEHLRSEDAGAEAEIAVDLEILEEKASIAAEEVAKSEQLRADAQAAAVASEGDLAAYQVHQKQVRSELENELDEWLKEQDDMENSDVQQSILANQKAHMERIKRRAVAAKQANKDHDQALIDELAAHTDSKTHH